MRGNVHFLSFSVQEDILQSMLAFGAIRYLAKCTGNFKRMTGMCSGILEGSSSDFVTILENIGLWKKAVLIYSKEVRNDVTEEPSNMAEYKK